LDGVLAVVAVEDGEVHVGVKVVVWWEPDGYISWGEEEGVPGKFAVEEVVLGWWEGDDSTVVEAIWKWCY